MFPKPSQMKKSVNEARSREVDKVSVRTTDDWPQRTNPDTYLPWFVIDRRGNLLDHLAQNQ